MSFVETKLATALTFYNGKARNVAENGLYTVYGANGLIGFSDEFLFENAIIIGRVGAYCGAILYCKEKFWASDNTIVVKNNDGYDIRYLTYLLGLMNLNQFAGGSAQPLLTHGWIKPIKIQMPTLPTQKKIAGILSAYDDLIENNSKRIKLLEEMARITYEEWFVRLRFPGHEAAPENPKTGLLEGWKEVKLGDVLELIKRGVAPKYVEEGGIMVINQKCIRDHRINLSFVRQTSKDKKIPAEKLVKYSDILVNSTGTGTLGRVAQYFGPNKFCTVDTHVTIVRANTLKVSTYILGRFLEHIEPFLVNLGKGATNQQELAGSDMSVAIKLKLPPLELQAKYEDMVKPIFEEIETLQNQNRRLREARDILLPRLMTGMIDVEHYKPENLLKEVA